MRRNLHLKASVDARTHNVRRPFLPAPLAGFGSVRLRRFVDFPCYSGLLDLTLHSRPKPFPHRRGKFRRDTSDLFNPIDERHLCFV